MDELVTVIIVAYNEAPYLSAAINSALRQTHRNLELIIVDDASTDLSASIIKEFQDSRIRYIRNASNQGIARSRNIGLGHAKGPYVFFTDADCMPCKNWIEHGLVLLKEPGTLAVEGATYYATAAAGASDKITQNPTGGAYFTCNMGYRRSVLEDMKGFDERYKNYFEDTDLARRILKRGAIPFCQDMIVIHQRKKKSPDKLFAEWSSRYEGLLENDLAQGRRFGIIRPGDLLCLMFPLWLLIFYRINSLQDLKILPAIYGAIFFARLKLWAASFRRGVLYL